MNRSLQILENQIKEYNKKGQVFAFHTRGNIGGSTTIELAMKIPTTKIFEALPAMFVTTTPLDIDFYQDVTITGYTSNIATQIRCMNQYNPKSTAVTEVLTVPVISDYGELNYPDLVPANQFSHGVSQLGVNWLTKAGVYYSVKIVNTAATAGKFRFSLYWIEKCCD